MKRVLAIGVACLLMAGALLVRQVITDDGGDEDGEDEPSDSENLVVACIPELEAACEALDREVEEVDLRIEDPGDTIANPDDVDAWVTLDPWPEMAALPQFDGAEAVASSDLVLLVREDAADCAEPATWVCVVDRLGDDATLNLQTAVGLFSLAQAANEFHPGFAGNEVRDDPQLQQFLRSIGTTSEDPVQNMLVLPEPNATGTTDADVRDRVEGSATGESFASSPTGSPATVAVVVAGPEADRIAREPSFTDELEQLGWSLDEQATTTGLPNPGVLIALSQEVAP